MQETLHNRHKIIIILIALLINLLLVLPLIFMNLDLTPDAFVLFTPEQEEALDPVTIAQQEPEELIEHILSSGAVPVQNDQEIQHDMEVQPNPAALQASPGNQLEDETVQEPEQEKQKEEEPQQKDSQDSQEEQKPSELIDSTPTENTMLISDSKHTAEQPKEMEKTPEKPQPKPKPHQQLRQQQAFGVSLGQLAQGFIKSMQQEEGLNNPQMDADKLAAHQYATRIWNIIKNSFKADANMLHLSQNVNTTAYLVITIAQNGRLIDIRLEGNHVNTAFRQIESLICTHAKKAGLFPPLPKRFTVAQKTFTFPIQIQGQEGYHSYRLSYGKT